MRGRIIKGIAGFYYVYAENGVLYECKARGLFRRQGVKPLVGDEVLMEVTHEKDEEGNVTEILPRKNALIRPAVANVDQALVVFAFQDPEPNYLLLDRFLSMMRFQKVPVNICFSKADLADPEQRERVFSLYRHSGAKVLAASAVTGEGVEEVKKFLTGYVTVVAGPSGVGKSSLANLLQQDIVMQTGEISRKLKRGKHTTRHSQLIPAGGSTFLVDTPGFTSLYLPAMTDEELKDTFPEFAPYEERCRFQGCRHLREPDCVVKEAVESGEIPLQRYENYLSLLEELKCSRRM